MLRWLQGGLARKQGLDAATAGFGVDDRAMDAPRYLTLRDYLRVLRSHGVLILIVTAAFAGGTYLFVSQQTPKYAAEASLAFKDPTADFQLVA